MFMFSHISSVVQELDTLEYIFKESLQSSENFNTKRIQWSWIGNSKEIKCPLKSSIYVWEAKTLDLLNYTFDPRRIDVFLVENNTIKDASVKLKRLPVRADSRSFLVSCMSSLCVELTVYDVYKYDSLDNNVITQLCGICVKGSNEETGYCDISAPVEERRKNFMGTKITVVYEHYPPFCVVAEKRNPSGIFPDLFYSLALSLNFTPM